MSQEAKLGQVIAEGASPALVELLRGLLACACTSSATGGLDPDDLFADRNKNGIAVATADTVAFTTLASITTPASATGRYLVMGEITGIGSGEVFGDGEMALFVDGVQHGRAFANSSNGNTAGSAFYALLEDAGVHTFSLRFRSATFGSTFTVSTNDAQLIVTEIEA